MKHVIRPVAEARQATAHELWGSLNWLASHALTGSAVTVGRTTIRPGHHNPRHCHPNCEEVLHLLAGRIEHSIGDETFILEAGDTITIPPGIFHNAVNLGDTDADMIVVFSTGHRGFVPERPGDTE